MRIATLAGWGCYGVALILGATGVAIRFAHSDLTETELFITFLPLWVAMTVVMALGALLMRYRRHRDDVLFTCLTRQAPAVGDVYPSTHPEWFPEIEHYRITRIEGTMIANIVSVYGVPIEQEMTSSHDRTLSN